MKQTVSFLRATAKKGVLVSCKTHRAFKEKANQVLVLLQALIREALNDKAKVMP